MPTKRQWFAGLGAILIVGVIPAYFAAVPLWAKWERHEAPKVAARVLDTFSPPCAAENVELRCEVSIQAMPVGSYTFVLVDSGPIEGVYVRARYANGSEVELDVFPSFLGKSRAVIIKSVG